MLYDPAKEAEIEKEVLESKVRDILLRAAIMIEKHGWCQSEFQNCEHNVCIRGAINLATWGSPWPIPHDLRDPAQVEKFKLKMYAVAKLELFLGTGFSGSFEWNDRVGRSQKEVIAALRGAANA